MKKKIPVNRHIFKTLLIGIFAKGEKTEQKQEEQGKGQEEAKKRRKVRACVIYVADVADPGDRIAGIDVGSAALCSYVVHLLLSRPK